MSLVVKTLHNGLPLKAPCVTVFANRVFKAILRICKNLISARRLPVVRQQSLRIEIKFAAVELETIHAEITYKPIELFLEPRLCVRMRKVEKRRIAVPPA